MEESLKNDDKGMPAKERIKALNEENALYFAEKKKIQEQIKELNDVRAKQTGDLPDLIKEREALSTQIQEKIKERGQIRAEKKEADNKYYQYQQEIRKIKQ